MDADRTCPECGGQGTYYGCKACDDTGRRRCSLYTARRWSPTSERPEDDQCVNCGQPEAAHFGSRDGSDV